MAVRDNASAETFVRAVRARTSNAAGDGSGFGVGSKFEWFSILSPAARSESRSAIVLPSSGPRRMHVGRACGRGAGKDPNGTAGRGGGRRTPRPETFSVTAERLSPARAVRRFGRVYFTSFAYARRVRRTRRSERSRRRRRRRVCSRGDAESTGRVGYCDFFFYLSAFFLRFNFFIFFFSFFLFTARFAQIY